MSHDVRRYMRDTQVRLILGGLFLLFVVGDGLIYLIYGPAAAISGLLCLGGGLVPVLIIIGFLGLMDWIVKRANRE
jgi:hypothetical protein